MIPYLNLELFFSDIQRCEYFAFKGNGFCDDGNNIMECDYDGGDCCGNQVKHGHCTLCQCLDEEENQYASTGKKIFLRKHKICTKNDLISKYFLKLNGTVCVVKCMMDNVIKSREKQIAGM